jgi:hypothetical protein
MVNFERGNLSEFATKSKLHGIKSNNTTKSPSVMNMFYYLKERRAVSLNDFHTLNELRTFGRTKNGRWGKLNDRADDDRVDALTWALLVLDPKLVDQFYIVEMKDVNGRPLHLKRGYTVYHSKKTHDDYRFLFSTNDYSDLPTPYVMGGGIVNNDIMDLRASGWVTPGEYLNQNNFF